MRHLPVVWLACATAFLLPSPALPGEVPSSALSQSLLVPPELLDNEALLFQYPQLSPIFDAQILATASSSSEEGVGGNAHLGRNGIFFLSQETRFYSSGPGYGFNSGAPTRVLQAGYGVRMGEGRIGIAGRASRSRSRSENTFLREGEDPRINSRDSQINRWEVAFGAGLTHDRWLIDTVVELVREGSDLQALSIRERSPIAVDTTALALESDTDPGVRVSTRVAIPMGASTTLRLAGAYHDQTSEVKATLFLDGDIVQLSQKDYAHEWAAALALELARPMGTWRVFGDYANRRGPERFGASSSGTLSSGFVEEDRAQIGLSFGREIFRDYEFMAGARASWERLEFSRRQTDLDSSDLRAEEDETVSQSFSWGLAREYERLRLTGAMSTNLNLDNLFLSLDATLRL